MGVTEAIALAVVLLAALYGIATSWMGLALWVLRPRDGGLRLVVHLKGAQPDAEARVRYALEIAKRHRIPLVVEEEDTDEVTKRIVGLLLRDNAAKRC